MKRIRIATIALLLGAVTYGAAYGQSQGYDGRQGSPQYYDDDRGYDHAPAPRIEVGFFYDELSPYGDWVLTRDYGWAWFPRDVHPYWRPYRDGRWVTTEYGWTWASYEPFGWATYHYGRWAWDPRFGWLWVPGTIWGPAWVSWQYGSGYVGWAPLPPAVGFEIGIGIQLGGFDLSIGIRPDAYSFVPERSFLESRLSRHLIPTARNVTIIHNTTNITNYTYIDNRVVNRGVEVRSIERATGRRVQPLRVAGARSKTRTEVAERELRIYRPEKQKLDSVRIGPRVNAGLRAEKPPAGRDSNRPADRPAAGRRDTPEFEVAPRTNRVPQANPRQLEQQERREQQELERYQAEEKRRIGKLHQQEIGKVRAQAERSQVEKHQQAERAAQQQEQRNAAQRLEARQKVQREAALAKPPGRATPPPRDRQAADQQQEKKKAVDQRQEKKKAADQRQEKKGKGQQQKKEKGRGQDETPKAPPPA